jgi:hypothetical protein
LYLLRPFIFMQRFSIFDVNSVKCSFNCSIVFESNSTSSSTLLTVFSTKFSTEFLIKASIWITEPAVLDWLLTDCLLTESLFMSKSRRSSLISESISLSSSPPRLSVSKPSSKSGPFIAYCRESIFSPSNFI